MKERELILQNLRRMADAVVTLLGRNSEACVHDLSSLQKSLVYVRGNVTSRKVGAPATDLLLKLLHQNSGRGSDLHNYKTTTSDGRALKSTTTFIRDSTGKPVAAFCINLDTTDFYNASQALMPFITFPQSEPPAHPENFAQSAEETIDSLFHQAVESVGKHPVSMNLAERRELICRLEANSAFLLKGAVEQVARLMGVTRYTIYNYLKTIRKNQMAENNDQKDNQND